MIYFCKNERGQIITYLILSVNSNLHSSQIGLKIFITISYVYYNSSQKPPS